MVLDLRSIFKCLLLKSGLRKKNEACQIQQYDGIHCNKNGRAGMRVLQQLFSETWKKEVYEA
jgi:hypothetical protein